MKRRADELREVVLRTFQQVTHRGRSFEQRLIKTGVI